MPPQNAQSRPFNGLNGQNGPTFKNNESMMFWDQFNGITLGPHLSSNQMPNSSGMTRD